MNKGTPTSTQLIAKTETAGNTAITVLLPNKHVALLDKLSLVIRRRSGKALSRSALIRAVVDATLTLRADWKDCEDEEQVCLWILAPEGKQSVLCARGRGNRKIRRTVAAAEPTTRKGREVTTQTSQTRSLTLISRASATIFKVRKVMLWRPDSTR